MKKIFAAFLTIIMVLHAGPVLAESVDLSGYDDSALIELLAQVQQEIADRNIEKTADLAAGQYICGRDIPAGTYLWICRAQGEDWGNLTVYSLNAEGKHDKQKYWEVAAAPKEGEEPESCIITIEDGDELTSGIPFSLTIYAGPKFQ